MGLGRPTPANIDDYVAAFPAPARQRLAEIRHTIRQATPDAVEAISYGIPAFKAGGPPFIYFAGFEKHVSVYPVPLDHPELGPALAPHASGKATARFRVDAPIPTELVARVARLLLERQAARARTRRRKGNAEHGKLG